MTNITLSIEREVYEKMRKYSEIKWSEFVRKVIAKRIAELEKIDNIKDKEGLFTMLASESALKKDWDNELDNRWNNV